MTKVNTKEIEDLLNRGEKVTFVDSRASHVWYEAEVKAAGSVRIPPDEVEKHLADVSRDDYIVTYCT